MGRFSETLKESTEIFSANPVLILPKLFVAILYSALILATTAIAAKPIEPSVSMLVYLLLLLISTIAMSVLDTFFGSMYPVMVKQVREGKKVGLMHAFREALAGAGKTLPPVLAIELGFVLLLGIFWLIFSFIAPLPDYSAPLLSDPYGLAFSAFYLLIAVLVVFFFYLIFPVTVFEKTGFLASFRRSVQLSLEKKGEVAKATLLSVVLSGVSFGIAFMINAFPEDNNLLFWSAFLVIRFLTAYVYTYVYVLNPVFYLNYVASSQKTK